MHSFSAFVSSGHNIASLLLLKIMGFATTSLYDIELKTDLKVKKQQYSFWNESFVWGLNNQFPFS